MKMTETILADRYLSRVLKQHPNAEAYEKKKKLETSPDRLSGRVLITESTCAIINSSIEWDDEEQ